jgi:hypothetical protein
MSLPSSAGTGGTEAAADPVPAVPSPAAGWRRFMVVRTFPAGALDGLDATVKKQVNEKNSQHSARWVHSYANADRTKTFCVYEGPNETAIREAATANGLPVDSIVEIPVVLNPQ